MHPVPQERYGNDGKTRQRPSKDQDQNHEIHTSFGEGKETVTLVGNQKNVNVCVRVSPRLSVSSAIEGIF